MTHPIKTLALAAGLALGTLASAASAATLSLSGGTTVAVPNDYDPHPGVSVPGGAFTLFKSGRNGGSIGGGLKLDSEAMVTYTFLGKEAAATNTLIDLSQGTATALFTNKVAAGTSATVRDDGGFLDFVFRTNGLKPKGHPAIANGGASDDKRLGLAFSDIFNEGRSVIAAFGDGRGDNDYDDLVVQIDVAPVPVPAAGLLLVGALGAMGGLRRMRRA